MPARKDPEEPPERPRSDAEPPPDDQAAGRGKDSPEPRADPPVSRDIELDETERETAYGLLQRGLALIKSRHHAQAAIVLERASRAEPGKGSILEPLGRSYHHSGQFELARETFEALLEVDPSHHWAHFALATTLRKLDRVPEARTHLRLAVALCPTSELYRRALARVDPPRTEPDAA